MTEGDAGVYQDTMTGKVTALLAVANKGNDPIKAESITLGPGLQTVICTKMVL